MAVLLHEAEHESVRGTTVVVALVLVNAYKPRFLDGLVLLSIWPPETLATNENEYVVGEYAGPWTGPVVLCKVSTIANVRVTGQVLKIVSM